MYGGRGPLPGPFSLPKIPYGVVLVWTRPSAGRYRRLTIQVASSVPSRVGIIVCDDGSKDSYRNVLSFLIIKTRRKMCVIAITHLEA